MNVWWIVAGLTAWTVIAIAIGLAIGRVTHAGQARRKPTNGETNHD